MIGHWSHRQYIICRPFDGSDECDLAYHNNYKQTEEEEVELSVEE